MSMVCIFLGASSEQSLYAKCHYIRRTHNTVYCITIIIAIYVEKSFRQESYIIISDNYVVISNAVISKHLHNSELKAKKANLTCTDIHSRQIQGSRLLSWPRTKRLFIRSAYGSSKTQHRSHNFSLLCTCVTHRVEATAATTAA